MPVAIYHFNVKVVSRSKGASAVAKAAYISGEKIKNEYDGKIHDYRKKKEIVHKEILLPDNAPEKFKNRYAFWNAVENAETRKNSQTAKHINAALPAEISHEQQIDLVRNFCLQCFVSKGMCVDFAIHDKGDGNPHVHILINTRRVDKNGFTKKDRSWNDKSLLLQWRECWADWCNHKLHFVSDERIDHRSYKAQGINKIPQVHLGTAACAIEKKGYRTDKGSKNRKIILENLDNEIERIKADIAEIKQQRNGTVTSTIEEILDCGIFETMSVQSDSIKMWEQFKILAEKSGVNLCVLDKKTGGQAAYFKKADYDKINEIYNQLISKRTDVSQTVLDRTEKKRRSR